MILFWVFLSLGAGFGWLYFFDKNKFSFDSLLIMLWLWAIAIAQLRLSPLEQPWSNKFWLMLVCFFVLFFIVYRNMAAWGQKKFAPAAAPDSDAADLSINRRKFFLLTLFLVLACAAANIYIFQKFGTLPILSTVPDKMRFIINRQVFGLWEYAALLPRLFIPLIFIYLLAAGRQGAATPAETKLKFSWPAKILAIAAIIFGFAILALYASRLIIVITVLLCYFSYLIMALKKINFKKIFLATLVAVMVILTVSVSIPAARQYITYRDYYSKDIDYTPFTYLADLAQINLPANRQFLIPLYLIPSFNLQALSRATNYFNEETFFYGRYGLSVFNPALRLVHAPTFDATVPWKTIFLPWWVTGSFLFNYIADFGYFGLILAALFWGAILGLIYGWATQKPSYGSIMLFAYFSFVVIMTIYTNYFLRPEMYLDLAMIGMMGWILRGC